LAPATVELNLEISSRPLAKLQLVPRPIDSQELAEEMPSIGSAIDNSGSNPASVVTVNVTTNLSGEDVRALPSSGRHWEEFLLQSPAASASLGQGNLDSADISVDGASARLAFGSTAGSSVTTQTESQDGTREQEYMGSGWSGRDVAVSEAALKEFSSVAGSIDAAETRATTGQVGLTTDSGANALHGQGFFYARQGAWGARNPFAQQVQNAGTASSPSFEETPYTPPDREIAWGVGVGGRIKRDKLFWFSALDGYGRNDPGIASVRNFEEMFAPVEPTSPQVIQLSAQLGETPNQAYQDYMGIPRAGVASAGLEQLAALLGPTERTASHWVGFARVDWQAGERQQISAEGTLSSWNSPGGGLTGLEENYGSHSFGSSQSRRDWLIAKWELFLTANLLASTQAYASRTAMTAGPQVPSAFEKTFLSGNSYGQLPQIVVDSRYGFTIGNPARFGQGSYPNEHMYSLQEMLSWVKGKMLLRTGFEVDHNTDAITLLRNQTGTFQYTKLENFISDASVFERFGTLNLFNYQNPHNCNAIGKGLGTLPCYSYFTQTLGPNFWQVSTNDWAGWTTAQWQLTTWAVASAGLRWEFEQLPAPMKLVDNPELPLTEKLPALGSQWGPRVSLALGNSKRLPVLRFGYGIYYGRTTNATLVTAISQTGSLKGDLNFFIRPTDGLNSSTGTSAAPPFPNPLIGRPGSVVVPGAVEYAPNFRNPEVHQAMASLEQRLPSKLTVTATAMLSLGRRLPISIDTNYSPKVNPQTITYAVNDPTGKGPIKTPKITVPFYAMWPAASCNGALLTISGKCGRENPDYQQITEIMSRSNSTYEAAMLRVSRAGRRGLNFNAHYVYSHAEDWSPNESTLVAGSDVLDPADFSQEYGTSNLDVRHSATAMVIFDAPWKLLGTAGRFANGWLISGTGKFYSGLPYSMRTSGAIPTQMDFYGNPTIVGIGPGMNGSGGDNRLYGVGRNTFRYPETWKADIRLAKKFSLNESRELQFMVESFNLFNHRNVTALQSTGYSIENGTYGTPPTLNYLTQGTTGTAATTPAFGQPLTENATNLFRERQIQLGARIRF
jgi:hypothetical protein